MTIDTHHILPDFFWRGTNDSHAPVGGLAPLQWSKDTMISFMDDAGIDVAVMSVSTPGVHLGDSEKARSLARRCNPGAGREPAPGTQKDFGDNSRKWIETGAACRQ